MNGEKLEIPTIDERMEAAVRELIGDGTPRAAHWDELMPLVRLLWEKDGLCISCGRAPYSYNDGHHCIDAEANDE